MLLSSLTVKVISWVKTGVCLKIDYDIIFDVCLIFKIAIMCNISICVVYMKFWNLWRTVFIMKCPVKKSKVLVRSHFVPQEQSVSKLHWCLLCFSTSPSFPGMTLGCAAEQLGTYLFLRLAVVQEWAAASLISTSSAALCGSICAQNTAVLNCSAASRVSCKAAL